MPSDLDGSICRLPALEYVRGVPGHHRQQCWPLQGLAFSVECLRHGPDLHSIYGSTAAPFTFLCLNQSRVPQRAHWQGRRIGTG
jgi:hypothetical protein